MNLDRLDRIVIRDKKEIDRLLAWRDQHKDLVREYKPVLKEGLIESKVNGISYYFEDNFLFCRYKVFDNGKELMSFRILKYSNGHYRVMEQSYDTRRLLPSDVDVNIQSVVTVHFSFMAYMEHYTEYITERRERSSKVKKGKGGNKNKNRTIKIGRRVYDVSVPSTVLTEKRTFNRRTEGWMVSGHPRTYKKTGKVVWINSYIKGDKSKINPRSFHI